jgi:trk system potassium uptake protein TrkA
VYVVVGGGGKVGYYLAKSLLSEGHEVLVIERDPRRAEYLNEDLGSVVLRGDACEATVLNEAGVGRADVVVAATGEDEDNLVICQMAKRKFSVRRTIARINNPKNEQVFRLLGIDSTVSSTELILRQIEEQLPERTLVHLRALHEADLELVEVPVLAQAPVEGKRLAEVALPADTVILAVIHGAKTVVAGPEVRLGPGDRVVALTHPTQEDTLRQLLQP